MRVILPSQSDRVITSDTVLFNVDMVFAMMTLSKLLILIVPRCSETDPRRRIRMFGRKETSEQHTLKSVEKIDNIQSCAEFIQVRDEAVIQDSLHIIKKQIEICVCAFVIEHKGQKITCRATQKKNEILFQ